MPILGIETSCDETSIAVAAGERDILSNIVVSSLHLHKRYGGIVPEIACRHHTELINIVLDRALKAAKVDLADIQAISVTQGPGLVGALLVGVSLAKALSYSLHIPVIPVNHLHGHLYASLLSEQEPLFPATGLIVSGGHTNLVFMKDTDDIELVGQTRDDACGEAFDKVAKILGLGFPGGPVIENNAKKGNSEKISFPRSYLEKHTMDFSFSGIKTSVLYLVQGLKTKNKKIKYKTKSLLLGGGVTANTALRDRIKDLCNSMGVKPLFPPKGLSLDNAAMIAGLGYYRYNRKRFGDRNFQVKPNLNF